MSSPVQPIVSPPQAPTVMRPMFQALRIASSGLTAQQFRMNVTAQNIANVDTTRTAEGGPYQRRVVNLSSVPLDPLDDTTGGVQVAGVGVDSSDFKQEYNPGHPDADVNGYVLKPNINIIDENLDLMNEQRVFEANATVFQVAKAMLHRAIDI